MNTVNSGKSADAGALSIFKNRDYALYFAGQLISQVGTWMQQIALSWLTYKLTNSALLLAVVGVSAQLPSLLVMPFAGVWADRVNRKRIVFFTQIAAMVEAGILAYLTLTHQAVIWHLIALGVMAGIINAIDMPVRSAFVVDLVNDKSKLPAAIAMNSSLMNVSRLLGPAIAGFVVTMVGEGMCFLFNALSYVAVISALMAIKGGARTTTRDNKGSVMEELKSGVKYALGTTPIRVPILLLATFGFGAMAYNMLMPVFVKQIGGDANTLGLLSSASAFGSVLGTALLATRKSVIGMGRLALNSCFVYAVCLGLFAFANNLWTAMLILPALGAAMMLQMGCCNTILQSVVDEDKRGRVMSLFTLAFMGTIPLGSLLAGAISSHFGFRTMILCCAAYCLTVASIFAMKMPRYKKETRPIYVQMGLLEAEEEMELITKPAA